MNKVYSYLYIMTRKKRGIHILRKNSSHTLPPSPGGRFGAVAPVLPQE